VKRAPLDKPSDPLMGTPGLDKFEVLVPYLDGRQGNQYSQFGEDGLIEALFDLVGTTNRCCFEVGAADGVFCSNTKRLRDQGWHAVLIEKDVGQFEKLKLHEAPNVRTVCEMVGNGTKGRSLDAILAACGGIPHDLDFGVIDIDGQDYWVWSDMVRYKPRVMLVEFRPTGDPLFVPDRNGKGQAGLEAIRTLGDRKGYAVAAVTAVNVLFALKEVLT